VLTVYTYRVVIEQPACCHSLTCCGMYRDELSNDPANMMRKVEKFLGLPEAKYPQKLLEHRRCVHSLASRKNTPWSALTRQRTGCPIVTRAAPSTGTPTQTSSTSVQPRSRHCSIFTAPTMRGWSDYSRVPIYSIGMNGRMNDVKY
jgi:hypothetical protein